MQIGSYGRRLSRRALFAVSAAAASIAAVAMLGLASAGLASTSANVSCSAGATGLIAALNSANGGGGGTYQLSGVNNGNPMTGDNALPVVRTRITINGRDTTIAGDGNARILQVDAPNGSLTLNGLTLTGGFSTFAGGAIFNNEATLTVNGSVVTENAAPAGGGIASGTNKPGPVGTTTLNNSEVTD